MLPPELLPKNFAGYPPEARRLAERQIALLRRLPLAFVPLLLRELLAYDWKFPAERLDLERQFAYLTSLANKDFAAAMAAFSQLRLPGTLEQTDWVNAPAVFTEQLTAHLWATHQIDPFRAAAVFCAGVNFLNFSNQVKNKIFKFRQFVHNNELPESLILFFRKYNFTFINS